MKNAVFICQSASVILSASVRMFASPCFCFSFLVVCLSVHPALFTKACPSVPHSDSVSFSLSVFHITCQNAKFLFHPLLKNFWHSLNLYCTEALRTQQFYMQQSNATLGPSIPSSGCFPQFSFKEELTASFTPFFCFFLLGSQSNYTLS